MNAITPEERERSIEILRALEVALQDAREGLRGPVWEGLQYGGAWIDAPSPPYACRNMTGDLEGSTGSRGTDDGLGAAVPAAIRWLERMAEEPCPWCGAGADDDAELGYGPEGLMHQACAIDAGSSQEGANR